MKYKQIFTVKPNGTEGNSIPWPFPVDMLRYDTCFPTDTDSAMFITLRGKGLEDPDLTKGMQVHLARYTKSKTNLPTNPRWMTFGWHVVESSINYISI